VRGRGCVIAIVLVAIAACTTSPSRPAAVATTVAAYPTPNIPRGLAVPADVTARHEAAWRKLLAGDTRGATRDLSSIVRRHPSFYPSVTALGFIDLAERQFKGATARFGAATKLDDGYLPAWLGLADAALGMRDDEAAIAAMARIIAIDPRQSATKSRLELVRLRQVQALIETGRTNRASGKLPESQSALERALALVPNGAIILRELATTEIARGNVADAEAHARRATVSDPRDPEAWMALAAALEGGKKYREAAASVARANAIEPKPEWRALGEALREKAEAAALPAGFANLARAATVTRAEAATLIGVRLADLLQRAPRRTPGVATDVRGHWAADWILAVTRAGVMDIYANHTFQPEAVLRRSDLARMASTLVPLAAAGRAAELQRWRNARPVFADLASTNVSYRAAAMAVASGAMTAAGGRFEPTRAASGADLDSVATRILQLFR